MMKNTSTLMPSVGQTGAADHMLQRASFEVLGVISVSHLLNDMIQSLMIAVYPIFKGSMHLSFWQLGFVTLAYQLTASLLQPFVGLYTDRRPQPYSLPIAMAFSLCGLLFLSRAGSFPGLVFAAMLVGAGSSVFHPESSRVARMASGGRHGLAQSIFQVGGNTGSALGPLLAAMIIVPHGQGSIAWFAIAAVLAMVLLLQISRWYGQHLTLNQRRKATSAVQGHLNVRQVSFAIMILLMLIFSKYFYIASISNYLMFYLIGKFGIGLQAAQMQLFIFLAAMAAGTMVGGPLGDKIGRKAVIWLSILGVAPFTLVLPYANLAGTTILVAVIGLILSSAFSAILVYAQELIPGRVGMVSGLFFGFAFGMGGIGAATLGWLADHHGIAAVYRLCAYLPLIGIVAVFLPRQPS